MICKLRFTSQKKAVASLHMALKLTLKLTDDNSSNSD